MARPARIPIWPELTQRLRNALNAVLALNLDQSIEWRLLVDNEPDVELDRDLYQTLKELRTAWDDAQDVTRVRRTH